VDVGGRPMEFETGQLARQAGGSVLLKQGGTYLLATCCHDRESRPGLDFAPLQVEYSEKLSGAGRTRGGYLKREGRPTEDNVLVCRVIDRPLRPMMAKGWSHETQVIVTALSFDGDTFPDGLAVNAAGAACALSPVPMIGVVAGVKVGLVDGALVVNPGAEAAKRSALDLYVAGTEKGVLMIEGYADFLSERQMLEAITLAHAEIRKIGAAFTAWARLVGKEKKTDTLSDPSGGPELVALMEDLIGDDILANLRCMDNADKVGRTADLDRIKQRAMDFLCRDFDGYVVAGAQASASGARLDDPSASLDDPDESSLDVVDDRMAEVAAKTGGAMFSRDQVPVQVKAAFKEVLKRKVHTLATVDKLRVDGRAPGEVRPITIETRFLPGTHGSCVFTRGETQTVCTVTLGGDKMQQSAEGLEGQKQDSFYLHYFFPPYSVGEVGRIGTPGRREIGHGRLAERSLRPAVPTQPEWPYTTRVESNITESNGSSSMASVCGGCLALMDAGVPVRSMVAGVAMGLLPGEAEDGSDSVVLTDILGFEDALGGMDFKVSGDAEGLTAFQLDIKTEGLTLELMERALNHAREGRVHILGEMAKALDTPQEMAEGAPRIVQMQTHAAETGMIIGPGRKTIRRIIEESGVDDITINQEGQIKIVAPNKESLDAAQLLIEQLVAEAEPGKVYLGVSITSVQAFGCFVEVLPGKEGLVHVSELGVPRGQDPADLYEVGQKLDVKLLHINEKGQLVLSTRAVTDPEWDKRRTAEEQERSKNMAKNRPYKPGGGKKELAPKPGPKRPT